LPQTTINKAIYDFRKRLNARVSAGGGVAGRDKGAGGSCPPALNFAVEKFLIVENFSFKNEKFGAKKTQFLKIY